MTHVEQCNHHDTKHRLEKKKTLSTVGDKISIGAGQVTGTWNQADPGPQQIWLEIGLETTTCDGLILGNGAEGI